jgi:hypothetical protein
MPIALKAPEAAPVAQVAGSIEQREPERLVTLEPEVLSDAEHALGNLLQRLRHAARQAANGGAEPERLYGTIEDLEGLLQLIFDYVSPVDVELRPISANRIAETLAGQVRAHSHAEVAVGPLPAVQMALDRRLLGRSFALLGRALGRRWESSSGTVVEACLDPALERVEFSLCSLVVTASDHPGGGQEQLALAVARRLIELQGGELRWSFSDDRLECRILLPAPRSSDACD